jgi:hypothetical protein
MGTDLTGPETPMSEGKNTLGKQGEPDFQDPRVVLSVLEADQLVAAKRRTHFGRRELSPGIRILFWGLRVYVILMLIIVLLSVLRALHGVS